MDLNTRKRNDNSSFRKLSNDNKERGNGTLQVQQRPRNLASPTIEKREKNQTIWNRKKLTICVSPRLVRVLSAFSPRFVRVLSVFCPRLRQQQWNVAYTKNNSFHVHLWTTELHTTSSTTANRDPNIRLNTTTFLNTQLALNLRLRKLSIFLTQCWSSRVKTLRVLYLMLLWFTHTLKSRSERKPNTRLL